MVRLINKPIKSSRNIKSDFKFTPNDVVQLLQKIEELNGLPIELTIDKNGDLVYSIGESFYQIVGSGVNSKK